MTESLFYNKNTNKWEIMGLNFVKDSSGGSGGSETPANTYSKTEVNNLLSSKLDTSTYNTDKANFKTKVTVVSETEPTDKEVIWIKPGSGNTMPNFGSQKTDKPTMVMKTKTGYIVNPGNLKEIKYFAIDHPTLIDVNSVKTTIFNTTLNFDDFVVLGAYQVNAVAIIFIDSIVNKLQIFNNYNNSTHQDVQPNDLSAQYEMSDDAPFYYAYNDKNFYYWDKTTKQICCINIGSSSISKGFVSISGGTIRVVYK